MYYYHISILRMGTFICIQLLILFMMLYFMAFEFRCTMPSDFTMYVVAIVLPSKCLGHFAKRINKLKGRSKQRDTRSLFWSRSSDFSIETVNARSNSDSANATKEEERKTNVLFLCIGRLHEMCFRLAFCYENASVLKISTKLTVLLHCIL